MKRGLLMVLLLLALTGCARMDAGSAEEETSVVPVEQLDELPVPQQAAPIPEDVPEPPAVLPVPEERPAPAPVPEAPALEESPLPETPPQEEAEEPPVWAAAAEVLRAAEEGDSFQLQILEYDGDWTDMTVSRERDRAALPGEPQLGALQWSVATAEDWAAPGDESGNTLLLMADPENSILCRSGSDLAQVTRNGEVFYLRSVNPRAGEPYEWDLYGLLENVGESVLAKEVWQVAADGALTPQEAALALAEQIAENHRLVPEWVDWGVVDMRTAETVVFDLYRGTPEQFCCDMRWEVQLPDTAPDIYWVAGAGAGEPDEEGWRDYSVQALVEKNEEGLWILMERGTGGYHVQPGNTEGKPQLEWLVELFCLTEGETHDRIVPYLLLELPETELQRLPQLLDQLTEGESRALCRALAEDLEDGHALWTRESLGQLLGDYGPWMDA